MIDFVVTKMHLFFVFFFKYKASKFQIVTYLERVGHGKWSGWILDLLHESLVQVILNFGHSDEKDILFLGRQGGLKNVVRTTLYETLQEGE